MADAVCRETYYRKMINIETDEVGKRPPTLKSIPSKNKMETLKERKIYDCIVEDEDV